MKLNDVMLLLMQRLRNSFEGTSPSYNSHFSIDTQGGLKGLATTFTSWVAVTGSHFNDGVWFFDGTYLKASPEEPPAQTIQEDFSGTIYILKPPAGFVTLCRDIKAFFESPAGLATGAISMSESNIGRHKWSVTFARDENGTPKGWYAAFAPRINRSWRRMFESKCMVALNGGS